VTAAGSGVQIQQVDGVESVVAPAPELGYRVVQADHFLGVRATYELDAGAAAEVDGREQEHGLKIGTAGAGLTVVACRRRTSRSAVLSVGSSAVDVERVVWALPASRRLEA